MKVILYTERLLLREMDLGDYEALYAVLADSDIMRHDPYSFDEKRVRGWIERNMERCRADGFGLWAVCLKDTGEVIDRKDFEAPGPCHREAFTPMGEIRDV